MQSVTSTFDMWPFSYQLKIPTRKSHDVELSCCIKSFLGNLIRNEMVVRLYNKKDLLTEPKTRSGRVIRAPDRFSSKKYLKGSGFSGCDQYDRGFAGKTHGDYGSKLWEKESKTVTYKKNDFVVNDDEEEYYNDISSEEDECDYSETDESELDDDDLFDDE